MGKYCRYFSHYRESLIYHSYANRHNYCNRVIAVIIQLPSDFPRSIFSQNTERGIGYLSVILLFFYSWKLFQKSLLPNARDCLWFSPTFRHQDFSFLAVIALHFCRRSGNDASCRVTNKISFAGKWIVNYNKSGFLFERLDARLQRFIIIPANNSNEASSPSNRAMTTIFEYQ